MTTPLTPLRWGQNQVLPDNATAAWGARLIVSQDGYVDFVPDRSDSTGDTDALYPLLEERCGLQATREIISDLLKSRLMDKRVGDDFILYLDDQVCIHANTNGSAGYCYVTAWITS